jgi:hypothetical protein
MYTRLTGRGRQDWMVWRTSTAIAILSGEVNATCPSIPAVERPVLRRRGLPNADQRVRPAAQHQLLQVPDLGQVPFLCRREDPLP